MPLALRFWRYHWARERASIHVSGDNMAALSMVAKMQPHSATLGVIARELALDIADAIYEPQMASHVPGVANVAADALSRKHQPDVVFTLPSVLAGSTEVHPPDRDHQWWRTIAARQSQIGVRKGGDKSTIEVGASSSRKRQDRHLKHR